VQWGVAIGVSLGAVVYDLKDRRIPNVLVGPALAAGFVWSACIGGMVGLAEAAVGCMALAAPFVLLFMFAGGGAGDAKLMGAIGAWLGIINGLAVLVAVALSGVVFAAAIALAHKRLRALGRSVYRKGLYLLLLLLTHGGLAGELPETPDSEKMPYSVAVFAGVCIAAAGVLLWRISQ